MRTLVQLALSLVAVVVVVVVVMWALQRRLIYLPSGGPVPSARQFIEGARDVTLQTSDGLELHAWFVPARGSDEGMTVLVANGNAGDRSLRAPLAEALAAEGVRRAPVRLPRLRRQPRSSERGWPRPRRPSGPPVLD